MGLGKLNIWVSDVADACGTWNGEGTITVFDCKGILNWPCGRFLATTGKWTAVPGGKYQNIPFKCGHLEVELPPGCYWVIAGWISPGTGYIHLNYTTHVGIVEVGCDETACVKVFNPSVRLCWDWFKIGLQILASNRQSGIDRGRVDELEKNVEDLLGKVPRLPVEDVIEAHFKELAAAARRQK